MDENGFNYPHTCTSKIPVYYSKWTGQQVNFRCGFLYFSTCYYVCHYKEMINI